MKPIRSAVLVIAGLLTLLADPLRAVNPALIMFYGQRFPTPVVIEPGSGPKGACAFLWGVNRAMTITKAARTRRPIPAGLEGRPYIKFAVFWSYERWSKLRFNTALQKSLKPEDASQHGRIYPAILSEPIVIVATEALMLQDEGIPVPTELSGFLTGWSPDASDIQDAKVLKLPGF